MFRVTKKSLVSRGRLGIIKTKNGLIHTPCFLPDATKAAIRSLDVKEFNDLGIESFVVNTFHLFLEPGIDLIKSFGGVGNFMGWNGPIVSDSGGFQVFSLVHKNKNMGSIKEDGVLFKSPSNGNHHFISPEKSIQIQFSLGSDLIICFDDCPPNSSSEEKIKESVLRTISWAKLCKKEFDTQIKKRKILGLKPLLFGVIQGGQSKELRKFCAQSLLDIGFDGFGFGARPVDEDGNFLENILDYTASLIPDSKIRFNLGMGKPEDILRSVKMGWDLFDCVIPTREARHGRLYFFAGKKNLKSGKNFYKTISIFNTKFSKDNSPINKDSKFPYLRIYSKAYLKHLFKVQEPLALRLATLNNLEFYMLLMKKIRQGIRLGII